MLARAESKLKGSGKGSGVRGQGVRLSQARAAGYKGDDTGEAEEWLRAKAKGLDMSQKARIERARAMGFDVSRVWYHGTFKGDFGKEIDARNGDTKAFWVTSESNLAADYSRKMYGQSNILPLYINKNGMDEIEGHGKKIRDVEGKVESDIREKHPNGVIYKDVMDYVGDMNYTGESDIAAITDPTKVRSIFAAFDPDYKDSPNLLASKSRFDVPMPERGNDQRGNEPRLAPNGKPSNLNAVQWAQVRTPEFKAWFDGSVVKDKNGDPLIVYRGSADNNGNLGNFAWVSATQELASGYAERKQYSNVIPLFANIKNPFDLDHDTRAYSPSSLFSDAYKNADKESIDKTVAKKARDNFIGHFGNNILAVTMYFKDDKSKQAIQDMLSAIGYDGVKMSEKMGPSEVKVDTWAAFNSEQLKSATGNTGAFSGKNPDIRYSKHSAVSDLFADIDLATRESRAQSLKRWGLQQWRQLSAKRRRQQLGLLTGLQLVDVAKQMLPGMTDYAKLASMMEAYRRKIQVGDRYAQANHADGTENKFHAVEKLGADGISEKHSRLSDTDKTHLANVMHEATLYGLTPAEGFHKLFDTEQVAKEIAVLRDLMKQRSGQEQDSVPGENWNLGRPMPGVRTIANLKDEERQLLRKLQFDRSRIKEKDRVQALYDALPDAAKEVYKLERDSHVWMSHKVEDALVQMIEDGPLERKAKNSSIAQLRHDFEAQRASGDYFPLYREGEYWAYLKGEMNPGEGPRMAVKVVNAQQIKVTSRHGFNKVVREQLRNLGGKFRKQKGGGGYFVLPAEMKDRVELSLGDRLDDPGEREGEREFVLFHTEEERKEFIKKAESLGREVIDTGKKLEKLRETVGVSADFVGKVEDLLSQLGTDPMVAAVQDQVWQMYLQSLPELSSRKHMIHRNKTPGFGKDALLAYAHKMSHDAYGYARLKTGPALRQVMGDLKKDIEAAGSPAKAHMAQERLALLLNYQSIVLDGGMSKKEVLQRARDLEALRAAASKGDPVIAEAKLWADYAEIASQWKTPEQTARKVGEEILRLRKRLAAVQRINAEDDGHEFASNVFNELQQAYADMMNPRSSGWAVAANQVGYLFMMAFSPSAWLVNGLQTPVKSMPFVAARFGIVPTTKAFTEAYALAFGGAKDKKANALKAGEDYEPISIRQALTGEEAQAYRIAEDTGRIDNTRAHDLWGFAEEGRDRSGASRKWAQATGFGFHESERLNREVTYLAAFRVARRSGLGFEEAVDYAADVLDKTHLDYSAKNRNRFMRGDMARVALQFKSYSQGMMYLWLRSAYSAFFAKNISKAERLEARRYLAMQAGVQIAFAGALGLPIGGLMLAAQAALTGDDDDPWDFEAELRQALADLFGVDIGRGIAKGAGNFFGPADLHTRLSERDLLWRDQDKDFEGHEILSNFIHNLAGPSVGVVWNILDGLKLMGEGHFERGLEKTVPKFIAAPLKAIRYATEGAKTLKGDELIKDVGLDEVLAQAIGFTPSRLADRYEENTATKNIEGRIKDRRAELIEGMRQAVMNRDLDGRKEAMADIKAYNAKQPEKAIKYQDVANAVRMFGRARAKAVDGMVLDNRLKGKLDKRYEFAN